MNQGFDRSEGHEEALEDEWLRLRGGRGMLTFLDALILHTS